VQTRHGLSRTTASTFATGLAAMWLLGARIANADERRDAPRNIAVADAATPVSNEEERVTGGPPSPAATSPVLDGTTIAQRMRAALEPSRSSIRKLTFTVSGEGETTQIVTGQARSGLFDGGRTLTVVLAPQDAKGFALLVESHHDQPDFQWLWVPPIRRLRKLIPAEANDAFLHTDFTYADLGAVRRDTSYSVLGTEDRAGVKAYKLESIPEQKWYLSRIITWVAIDNFLPLERNFFDPAGTLYKVERFHDVTNVDGVPTPFRIRMENVQSKTTTEMVVSDLRFDASLPAELLDPEHLREAAQSPSWIWRSSAASH